MLNMRKVPAERILCRSGEVFCIFFGIQFTRVVTFLSGEISVSFSFPLYKVMS